MSSFRLEERDEYPHVPDGSPNFNESIYVNAFDASSGIGGWLRIGNRPNEGHAEVSLCLYLPDGRIACQFLRPSITGNAEFSAGGLSIVYRRETRSLDIHYKGDLLVLDDANLLREPGRMFRSANRVPAELSWIAAPASPIHGGEPTDPDQQTMYGRDFSLGHFNQHVHVTGDLRIGDRRWPFDGHGWRDHSWGPRFWHVIYVYRLFLANFGDGNGLMLLKMSDRTGRSRRVGALLVDGAYEEVEDLDLRINWNEHRDPRAVWIGVRTSCRAAVIEGEVLNLAPLRNRRQTEDGWIETRIAEGFTRFSWNDRVGYGMCEFIERIEDGRHAGYPL